MVAVLVAALLALLAACTGGSDDDGSSSAAAAEPAAVTVSPADSSTDVSPADPVRVAVTGGQLTGVTVTTADGKQVEGSVGAASSPASTSSGTSSSTASSSAASPSTAASSIASAAASSSGSSSGEGAAVWTPSDPLDYGTTYTLSAVATNDAGTQTTTTSTFATVKPETLSTPSIGPLDGTTVGVGMPIRVYFDQAVADEDKAAVEKQLKVTSSNKTDGVWSWLSDTEVHFRPSAYWPANTDVQVDADLYGVQLADGVWGEKDRTVSFTVGDEHISVADAKTHTLTVKDGGKTVQTYAMSAGSDANPTHNGAHVVLESKAKITMDSSTFGLAVDAPGGYRADVKWAVRISNNGEFVHAAPWSVASQGSSNVSHGCINLSTARAKWFFGFSQPGDVVEVVNSKGPTLSAADGDIYDWAVSWKTWKAGSALS